jgi:hypothetical protein
VGLELLQPLRAVANVLGKVAHKTFVEKGVLKTFFAPIQINLPTDLFDLYSNKLLQAKYTVSVF